jgi:hypothetical protein
VPSALGEETRRGSFDAGTGAKPNVGGSTLGPLIVAVILLSHFGEGISQDLLRNFLFGFAEKRMSHEPTQIAPKLSAYGKPYLAALSLSIFGHWAFSSKFVGCRQNPSNSGEI